MTTIFINLSLVLTGCGGSTPTVSVISATVTPTPVEPLAPTAPVTPTQPLAPIKEPDPIAPVPTPAPIEPPLLPPVPKIEEVLPIVTPVIEQAPPLTTPPPIEQAAPVVQAAPLVDPAPPVVVIPPVVVPPAHELIAVTPLATTSNVMLLQLQLGNLGGFPYSAFSLGVNGVIRVFHFQNADIATVNTITNVEDETAYFQHMVLRAADWASDNHATLESLGFSAPTVSTQVIVAPPDIAVSNGVWYLR